MNKKTQSFLFRLSVVIIFHLLFKQGDQSFSGAFEPSLRSVVFSLYFIVYWMLFWETCSFIYKKLIRNAQDKKIWYRKLSFVTLILMLFVIVCSIIFNYGYSLMDHYAFRIADMEDIPFLNPDFFGSSDILRSIKINPELFLGFMLFLLLP